MGLFEIPGEELSGRPENQLHEECQNKSSPSLDGFIWPFLSIGLVMNLQFTDVLYDSPDGFERTLDNFMNPKWRCHFRGHCRYMSPPAVSSCSPTQMCSDFDFYQPRRAHTRETSMNCELTLTGSGREEALTNAARHIMHQLCVLSI